MFKDASARQWWIIALPAFLWRHPMAVQWQAVVTSSEFLTHPKESDNSGCKNAVFRQRDQGKKESYKEE